MLTDYRRTAVTSAEPRAETASREVFLDAVRTLALVRVVLWHALGAAVLTYFLAAVPAMFFVTGSLLAKSLRKGARRVVVDRARRILVPLWAFTAAAFAAMSMAHLLDATQQTAVPWRDLVVWLLPFADPHGSPWEGGYVSSPLWYLRALLWLIVLSPLLLRLVRRLPALAFALPLTGLAILEWAARTGRWQGTWAWRVGDLALYGIFLILGFLHRDGRLDGMTRRRWLSAALVVGAAAALWCTTQPVPGHVVNDSHPAHLLVGLAWLCLLFAARPQIERLARGALLRPVIGWVNQRSITIYLWHTTAVVAAFQLLRLADVSWPSGTWAAALLTLTACGTLLLVLAFGWVDDLANRRRPRLWPGEPRSPQAPLLPRPVLALSVAGLAVLLAAAASASPVSHTQGSSSGLVLAASATATGGAAGTHADTAASSTSTTQRRPTLRVPSQQPKAPVFNPKTASSPAPTTSAPGDTGTASPGAGSSHAGTAPGVVDVPAVSPDLELPSDTLSYRLQTILSNWMAANDVPGMEAAVFEPGIFDWSTARGFDPTGGTVVSTSSRFDVASITKTFTAALTWKAIDDGLINPDDSVGKLRAVPDFPYTDLTPRQLLQHSTGLANFRETPQYLADPASIDTPARALSAAGQQPLAFAPDSQSYYSTTNYLVLGFLLEQVTGRSFERLLGDLVARVGLGEAPLAPSVAGSPNFSVAGLQLTISQVARWGVALLHDNAAGLSDAALQSLETIDPNSSLGQGLWGYCPCTSVDGELHWAAYGHTGSTTELQFSPESNLSIAVNVTDSAWAPENRQDALLQLFEELRSAVLGNSSA